MVYLIVIHPHPASPVHACGGSSTRGKSYRLPPLAEGIEGGGKMEFSLDQLTRMEASSQKDKKGAHKLAREYGPILDSFNDVVFITDKAGHFVFVNKASGERTGIPTEAFIGLHFLDILDPQYHEYARSSFQKAMRGDRAAPAIEMERQTATGERVTLGNEWGHILIINYLLL